MLAAGGWDNNVKIFDKRESKIVQTFDGIHTSNSFLFNEWFLTSYCYFIGFIYCVRWSPSGDMIASTSFDNTVQLLDFKTGKTIYTGNTSEGGKLSLFD